MLRKFLILFCLVGVARSLLAEDANGRLEVPIIATTANAAPGLQSLGNANRAFLYLPKNYRPSEPLPLLILLHPSGGNGGQWFSAGRKGFPGSFAARADAGGFGILAPTAPGATWGVGPRAWGSDVGSINRAIAETLSRCAIDRRRIAIGGFSDGASYALSLGLANGDLIKAVVAFSPGFIVKAVGRGRPALFISHGREDFILPIDTASRLFVRQLHRNDYAIDYQEFDGGHEIPPAICDQAVAWLTAQLRR